MGRFWAAGVEVAMDGRHHQAQHTQAPGQTPIAGQTTEKRSAAAAASGALATAVVAPSPA